MTELTPRSHPTLELSAHDALAAARAWSDPGIFPAERTTFLEHTLAPDNLRRAFWLLLVYLPVTIIGLIYNSLILHASELNYFGYVDLVCSFSLFLLIIYLRRHASAFDWKRYFLIVFYIYNIGLMTAYYFAALPIFGETSYYTLGLLMMALLVRLPPRQFIPILLVIHGVYCALLLRFTSDTAFTSGLFNGTNSLILALLAAWFLFHREWDTYEKGRVITQRNHQLAAAVTRINEVTAIAAHDLRSPIASVLSYIHVLQSEEDWNKEPYKRTLDELYGILDGALHLIGRMLHAHDAESKTSPQSIQAVDVPSLIQRSVARLQYSAHAKNIQLHAEIRDSLEIQTSRDVLEQALDNLISNAVKFSPLGSQVRITAHRDGSFCVIAVQDSGPGIPPEETSQLFSKFHRGRNKPTAGEASSGIGLFIVQQLMASLHGTVDYEPARPTGSIFRLRLPIDFTAETK